MNVLTDWFIPLYNTECVIHETNTISMNKQISETQNLGKYLRIFPELWSKLCQNIKTCKPKCQTCSIKKQQKAMCASERPLYETSNGMCWIKTKIIQSDATDNATDKSLLANQKQEYGLKKW